MRLEARRGRIALGLGLIGCAMVFALSFRAKDEQIDRIERLIVLPNAASSFETYARYYTAAPFGGVIQATYIRGEAKRPGRYRSLRRVYSKAASGCDAIYVEYHVRSRTITSVSCNKAR